MAATEASQQQVQESSNQRRQLRAVGRALGLAAASSQRRRRRRRAPLQVRKAAGIFAHLAHSTRELVRQRAASCASARRCCARQRRTTRHRAAARRAAAAATRLGFQRHAVPLQRRPQPAGACELRQAHPQTASLLLPWLALPSRSSACSHTNALGLRPYAQRCWRQVRRLGQVPPKTVLAADHLSHGCPDKPELLLHRARGGAARHQALSSVYSKSLSDVIGTAPRAVLETRWRAGASARC